MPIEFRYLVVVFWDKATSRFERVKPGSTSWISQVATILVASVAAQVLGNRHGNSQGEGLGYESNIHCLGVVICNFRERLSLGSQFTVGHSHLSSHVKSLAMKEFFGIAAEQRF